MNTVTMNLEKAKTQILELNTLNKELQEQLASKSLELKKSSVHADNLEKETKKRKDELTEIQRKLKETEETVRDKEMIINEKDMATKKV